MKVVILAGGYGTRLAEHTKTVPKPMVKIKKLPIIIYIIRHYKKYGFRDFIIASGYKGKFIKDFFKKNNFGVNIEVINTGLKTMTGGRIKRLEKKINNKAFLLTYGDGVSNVNLTKLLTFHKKHKFLCTLTAVRPPARFGAIKVVKNRINYFKEKSKMDVGWINGGFFVFEPSIFKYIKNDKTFLEREPLEILSKKKKLGAFKHDGYWQCMDTIRDKEILEKTIKNYT